MLSHGMGLTERGQQRPNNEDALHVDDDLGLYVVCDGAGGHARGEVAAATAVRAETETYARSHALITRVRRGSEPHSALEQLARRAVDYAAQQVFLVEQSSLEFAGMGTTLTLLSVADDKAVVAHVGDSRAYLHRVGAVRQLTTDHTVTAMLVQLGHISPAQQASHTYRNYLTRALGMRPPVPVQTLPFAVMPGDRLLLCSDGLSDYLDNTEALADYLRGNIDAIPGALLALASRAGGADDITSIAVGIESKSQRIATRRVRPAQGRRLSRLLTWATQSG